MNFLKYNLINLLRPNIFGLLGVVLGISFSCFAAAETPVEPIVPVGPVVTSVDLPVSVSTEKVEPHKPSAAQKKINHKPAPPAKKDDKVNKDSKAGAHVATASSSHSASQQKHHILPSHDAGPIGPHEPAQPLKDQEKLRIAAHSSYRLTPGFAAKKLDFDQVTSEFTRPASEQGASQTNKRGIASIGSLSLPAEEVNSAPSLLNIPSWFGNSVNQETTNSPFFEGLGKPQNSQSKQNKNRRNPASVAGNSNSEDLLAGSEIPLVLVLDGNQFVPQVLRLSLGKRYMIHVLNHKDQEGALIVPSFNVQLALTPTQFTDPFVLEPTSTGQFRFYCPLSGATGTLLIE